MITVRFPTGFSLRYNGACISKSVFSQDRHLRINDMDGCWIADAPPGCIIESVAPCAMSNPGQTVEEMIGALLAADLHAESWGVRGKLAELKTRLQGLNRQTRRWKGN